MLPYKQTKSPIKKFKEEENETGKLYLVLKILGGAKKDKDWLAVDEAISMMGDMLDSMKESKKKKSLKEQGDVASLEQVIELWKKGWKATPKIINKYHDKDSDYEVGLLQVPTGHKLPVMIKVLG